MMFRLRRSQNLSHENLRPTVGLLYSRVGRIILAVKILDALPWQSATMLYKKCIRSWLLVLCSKHALLVSLPGSELHQRIV